MKVYTDVDVNQGARQRPARPAPGGASPRTAAVLIKISTSKSQDRLYLYAGLCGQVSRASKPGGSASGLAGGASRRQRMKAGASTPASS
jgi:hypothetical protein